MFNRTAVPKPNITVLSAHLLVSTTLIDLQPSHNYTVSIAIGHRKVAIRQAAWLDTKYSIRISNTMVGYGTVCGFSSDSCPYAGLNNSTYMALTFPFQAYGPSQNLTVYLSWYNGNFNVPIYLDNVFVRPFSDNTSMALEQSASPSSLLARAITIPKASNTGSVSIYTQSTSRL